ncbi:MAG: Deoxyribonuclease, tatd family [candidate division TM6 bacterium GW2011_GWF2_32_72]|nr:MAG: Deoxyribonuclease, tatd family [candidate division TM6 bacterium GW2011_GWF2_32_72]
MFIDTHCHLNLIIKKDANIPITNDMLELSKKLVKEAKSKNVNFIINTGTNLIESLNSVKIAQTNPEVFAAVGIHPNDITDNWKKELEEIKKLLINKEQNKIVAIGECGLDYYWPGFNKQTQKDVFRSQLELALKHNLGLTIHNRSSEDEMAELLQEYKNDGLFGAMHCFNLDKNYADIYMSIGFHLGVAGPISYPKNEITREAIKNISLDKLVLETDAPFLPPQELRGTVNLPQNVVIVAAFLAELKNVPIEDVEKITTQNATKIFNLPA